MGDSAPGFDPSITTPRSGEVQVGDPEGGRPRPAQFTLSPGEELWVIERPRVRPAPSPRDDFPGCGALVTRCPPPGGGDPREVPIPLEHTDVHASVAGFISSVDVTQKFHNPFSEKIEAVYVFPLPEDAAVSEFVMTVGDRRIRGIVRERQEAEQIYRAARAQGHVASLLTQERPNIFTQSVANIEPGKSIDISVRYYHTLPYSDGAFTFVFPMTIGPRYNPAYTRDGVGAVARGAAGTSGQETEVQYLRPGERSGAEVSLTVDIDAGVSIEKVECPSHTVNVTTPGPCRASASLASGATIPNKDFVLRYSVAGDRVKSALITQNGPRGGYFTLMLVPPRELAHLDREALEVVFVIDASGSMDGRPIEQAKQAVLRGLDRLESGDTFQLINFSNSATQLGTRPLPATESNIRRARAYVEHIAAEGGTEMINGLRASLDFPHDPDRLRFVAFVTDGFIGNEKDILGALHGKLDESRIFSFGVGQAPNRYLMDSMARMGRGVAAYLPLDESPGEVTDLFFDRISHPALANVKIDWGSNAVADVFPSRTPDLFVGKPVMLTGRFSGDLCGPITVRGRAGGQAMTFKVSPVATESTDAALAMPNIWARAMIRHWSERATWDSDTEIPGRIRQTALDYGIMSDFTAFVAVDSMSRTAGSYGTTVVTPVSVPEGVKFETTVHEQAQRAKRPGQD